MTDSIRTRIAAVLSDALVADNSILTVQYGSGSWYDHLMEAHGD